MSTALHLTLAGAALAILSLTHSVFAGDPPRSDGRVEFQTGPIIVALAAPDRAIALIAEEDCLQNGCPVLALRLGSSAPAQLPEEEARRVQYLQTAALKGERLSAQTADQSFRQ